MNFSYDREAELREKFNQFIENKVTGVNEDYYSRLSVEDFEEIKTTLKGDYTLKAAQHIIKNIEADLKGKVEIYDDSTLLTLEKVYIVFTK